MKLKFIGPESPTRDKCIVLLHGAGANRHDLAPLSQIIDPAKLFDWYFPEAPINQNPVFNMNIWFPVSEIVDMVTDPNSDISVLESYVPPLIDRARKCLDEFTLPLLSSYKEVVIGGFSQGAMMAMDFYVRNPHSKIKGLIAMSGTMADAGTWNKISDSSTKPLVFQSHGDEDTILPERFGKQLLQFLSSKNFPVEFHGFHGGHEIPDHVLKRLSEFTHKVLNG
jgi:phospholipase/carboxylesterase